MTGQAVDPFPADALEVNRNGRITDGQRAWLRSSERAWRRNELVGAGLLAVAGVVLLVAAGPSSMALVRMAAGIGALILAAFFLYRAMPGAGPLAQDLRGDRVETVEGPVGKQSYTGQSSAGTTMYWLYVGNQRFAVSRAAYDATPEAGHVRLFVLPRSHKVLNLERLPDPPLPEGALDSPTTVLGTVAAGFRSHDRADRLEAAATLEAMKDAMLTRATPPPAETRDPRPLATAILGTWRAGPTEVSFAADGTAVITLPVGGTRSGRWSVDADGRLHVQGMGQAEATDAWVAGDTLTVVIDGQGIALRRVASA